MSRVDELREQYRTLTKQQTTPKTSDKSVDALKAQYRSLTQSKQQTQPVAQQPVVQQVKPATQNVVNTFAKNAVNAVNTANAAYKNAVNAAAQKHGQVAKEAHTSKQTTKADQQVVNRLKSGETITDTEDIKAIARANGISDDEIDYVMGKMKAQQEPMLMKKEDIYKKEDAESTKKRNPVLQYEKNYGTQEAKKEIQGLDFKNSTNGEKYLEYQEKLAEAKRNNDTRNIAKYSTLVQDFKEKYKENYTKDEEQERKDLQALYNNLRTKGATAIYDYMQRDKDRLINTRDSLNQLYNDRNEILTRYAAATTPEEKQRIAGEYYRIDDLIQEKRKTFGDLLAYDDTLNNNIIGDSASSFATQAVGGTANAINAGYSYGNKLIGNDLTTINPDQLLAYNNGSGFNFNDATNLINQLNPITSTIQRVTGQGEGPQTAANHLARIAALYPNNARLQNLLQQIANRSYTGTREQLADELDSIQKELYQGFKDRYTQDDLNRVEEQLRHNEAVYGNAAFIPNAFGTVGNMLPSMALGYATGGIAELAGGGAMGATGTLANNAQQIGSFGALGLGAAGQSMDEALANGAKYNQAQAYGALSGATEVGTEMIGGETINSLFGRYGKSALGKVFGKAVDELNIENKVAKFLLNQAGQVGSEMTEEMISEALNPIWQAVTYNPDALPKNIDEIGDYIKNILKAGAEAIPSTLLMQGGGMVLQSRNVSTVENGIIDSINSNPELSQIVKNQLINEVHKASREVKLGLEETDYIETKANERSQQLAAQSNEMKSRIPEGYSLPQSTVDILAYTENNRPGLNIAFDTNIQGNGTFVENPDGTRTITLNPNSKRAVEFTLTHELGHDLKGTGEYTQLQNLLTDYAKGKPGYQEALKSLDQTYRESGANYNLQDEATNDMLGQAIGEQEFYNKLAENPTLFNRVTQGLKNLLGNKESKLKNKIEKLTRNAYQSAYKGTGSNQVQNSLNENDKTLAATHSLTEDKLKKILDLGGIPVPSIAITKPELFTGDNYGDATIYFNKETINPENKLNETYSRDIFSPRFPEVGYKINKDVRNKIENLARKVGEGKNNPYIKSVLMDMYENNLSDRLRRYDGLNGLLNALKDDNGYKYFYQKATNPNFKEVYDNQGNIDEEQTNRAIYQDFNQADYEKWLKDTFSNLVEKTGIRNNKPYYTERGAARRFETLYEDYTLDNVVKIMTALNTTGEESFLGKHFNEIAATAAKKFNSIQDMKNSQDLLQNVSKENYKELLEPVSNKLRDIEHDIIDKKQDTYSWKKDSLVDYLNAMDSLGDTIQTVARKSNQKTKLTPSKVIEIMAKDHYDIDTKTAQRIIDVIYEMKNLPTKYFESKPQRAVGFNEISSILIPNTFSPEIKQALTDRGIKYTEYNPNVEGDREVKHKQAAQDVLFSKSNGQWQQFVQDNFNLKPGTRTNFLPTNEELQQSERKSVENEPVTLLNTGDETLFSLSEKQQQEVVDYARNIEKDNTLSADFASDIYQRLSNVQTYSDFENIKQEVQDYKDKMYKGISGLEDIANLKPEDVRQNEMTYKQQKDKNTANQRKFFENVETSPVIAEETKNRVNATTYEQKHNLDTLEEVRQKLDERGNDLVEEWKHKSKNFTAKDVALGAILVERYQQNGDWNSAARAVEKLADMGTEAGRAVQMYSIFQRLSPETMAIYQQKALNQAFEDMKKSKTGKWVEANQDKFKLTADETQFIYNQVEKASQAIDDETKQRELSKIETMINNKLPPEKGQTIKALRRIAMLFNPKTQVRNIVGNTLIIPVNDAADVVGAAVDRLIARRTGVRTTSLPNIGNKVEGIGKGVRNAVTDYKTKTRTTATGSKYEFEFGAKPFNENTKSKALNTLNKGLNFTNDLLSAIMSGGDRPFYEAAYKNSLEGQMRANKVTEATDEMKQIAMEEGLQRTWNDDNEYTKFVLGIRKGMNKLNIRGFGLGDLIIPFAKTPANLTKAMVEYSPVGFLPAIGNYVEMNKAISRGELTPMQQKKFVSSFSKAIAGTVLYAIADALAKTGAITGSGDDDKDVRNFEQNVLGIQPYSIRLGDKTYTYSWANPINAPLAIMADRQKLLKEDANMYDQLKDYFKVAGNTLLENSFLQGISDIFNNQDGVVQGLEDSITSMPSSLIPTFISQIASLNDDTQRQTYEYKNKGQTELNKIKNKIPGLRNTLEPSVNAYGEEIENQNNFFNAFFNPANVREARISDSQKALYDLYQETKDKNILPDVAPNSTNTGDGEKMNLTSKDKVTFSKTYGNYVGDVYEDLFNQEDAFTDNFKTSSNNNEGKIKILKKVKEDAMLKGRESVGAISEDNNSDLSKLNEKIDKLEKAGIPLADYYLMWYYVNNGEDKKNDTKRNGIGEVIRNLDHEISKEQKDVLYGIFNITK